MNRPTIRIGVVGTSWWADLVHLPSLTSHPAAEVVALAGRDAQRAGAVAHKYAIPQVYADYRAMIDRARLDALVISVPDDLHYPIAMAAIDAGLHVLCEKPLAMNAAQAREMLECAEAKRVKHMTFFTYRWMPQFQYMRQLLDGRYIGAPYHAQFIQLAGYARRPEYAWRFDARRANGVLADLGSHMIDLAHWLVGDIRRVSAHLSVTVARPDTPEPANDAAAVLLEFASGVQGVVHVSAVAHAGQSGHIQHTRLHGAAGTLEAAPHVSNTSLNGLRQGDLQMKPLVTPPALWGVARPEVQYDLFMRQAAGPRQFIDAILADRPITPSFYDGWKAQTVIDAALESFRTGAWQAVSA
ncbi:MAG: Gfo/Idh/MocA family oxidoreductase [Chloroflexi bacterium]|nr:Gfo/Idh/MocA family oxidoreductase [Chloroflexota bacterium]